MLVFSIFAFALFVHSPSACDSPSSRILRPEQQTEFYRDGGRALLGREVLLRVPVSVLRKSPQTVKARRGGHLLIFENRSVPIVIPDRLAYWRQARRHLDDARLFNLKGRLLMRKEDPRQRVHLYVTSIKRAHGGW